MSQSYVKKSDWNTVEFPKQSALLSLNISYSKEEYSQIQLGVKPSEMEDKWFIYCEDDTLYMHRSWTGVCVYHVVFEKYGAEYVIKQAKANRDREQCSATDDEVDAKLLPYLIETLLLKKHADYPPKEGLSPEQQAISKWSLVGRAMFGQYPDE
jgi:hypothetical protein